MYSEQDPSLFPGGINASIPPYDASDEVALPVSADEVAQPSSDEVTLPISIISEWLPHSDEVTLCPFLQMRFLAFFERDDFLLVSCLHLASGGLY